MNEDIERFAILKAAMEPEWCIHDYRKGSCLQCGDYDRVLDIHPHRA